MIRFFLSILVLLLCTVVAIGIHYFSFDRTSIDAKTAAAARMTRIAVPAWGVSYYESRIDSSGPNPAYPDMQPLRVLGAAYEE